MGLGAGDGDGDGDGGIGPKFPEIVPFELCGAAASVKSVHSRGECPPAGWYDQALHLAVATQLLQQSFQLQQSMDGWMDGWMVG